MVGADRIVLPEKEVGTHLADTLSSPFTDLTRLNKEFSVSKIKAPKSFIGKTAESLNLFENYNVHCIGIEESIDTITPIGTDHIIQEEDRLIVAGKNNHLEKLAKL